MAEEIFSTSSNLNINGLVLDVSNALDGQSLVFDGSSFVSADIVPIGAVEMWAGTTTPPSGWLLCNGQNVSRTTFSRLFSVVGTSFGSGDGSTTFSLPNFQLSVPLGVDGGASVGATTFNAASANHAHSHTVSGTFNSDGQDDSQSHLHGTTETGAHSHSLQAANHTHYHQSDGVSGDHRHNYALREGTGTTANTGAEAHTTHNGISGVAANMGAHTHTITDDATSHAHGLPSATTSHQHATWNGTGLTSNEGTSTHFHDINTQKIYFIIKH